MKKVNLLLISLALCPFNPDTQLCPKTQESTDNTIYVTHTRNRSRTPGIRSSVSITSCCYLMIIMTTFLYITNIRILSHSNKQTTAVFKILSTL